MRVVSISPCISEKLKSTSAIDLEKLFIQNHRDLSIGSFNHPVNEYELYEQKDSSGVELSSFYIAKISKADKKRIHSKIYDDLEVVTTDDHDIYFYDHGIIIFVIHTEVNIKNSSLTFARFDKYYSDFIKSEIAEVTKNAARDLLSKNSLRIGWTHKIFTQQNANERETNWIQKIDEVNPSNAENGTITKDNSDYFGWGCSQIRSTEGIKESTIYGCLAAQYHYFCLDRFNRKLPNLIKEIRQNKSKMTLEELRKYAANLKFEVSIKIIAYRDLLHSVAGDFAIPINSYDKMWKFNQLTSNLHDKLPLLESAIHEIESKSQSRSNAVVESMLFAVSSFSLVSLFISTHDYVAKTIDQKIPTQIILKSLHPISPGDILSFSILVSLIILLMYAVLRLKLISRACRLLNKNKKTNGQ